MVSNTEFIDTSLIICYTYLCNKRIPLILFSNANNTSVNKTQKEISKKAAEVFEGESAISPFEKKYGISVGDPRLFDLGLGKKSQDAAENVFVGQKLKEALEHLEESGIDPKDRLNAILAATGVAKKNIFDAEGLPTALSKLAEAFFKKS